MDVWEKDPTHFYVAYASGGLWKTENNGQSFTPLFENETVMTIGDIAVDWQRNVVWIGTGEVNSSRSSYSGVGMYRSEDGGKTWQHKGLPESHHIGRIVLHPTDPNTLWVAVLGHLYSPNQERGVYKTTDGGNTWRRVLYVNENSGAVDLVIDPKDPNTLYAATWHRERRAWDFVESGIGSGIHKSMDGGENWFNISGQESGFVEGEGTGRIGLAVGVKDGKSVLFAIIDNQNRRPKEATQKEEVLTKDELRSMTKESFLKLDKEKLKAYLKDNDFPEKYSADKVIDMVKKGEITPLALVEYTEDANTNLFDTPVIGAEVYTSNDAGKTWKKTHDGYLDDLFYSYGYYFGQIRVAPQDADKLYIFGVPILRSLNGGETWESINGDNVHGDHHALWMNPTRPGHLVLGNDGGINISYDNGDHWVKCNTPPVGQFYAVAVDMADDYNVYGGLQDNGVWTGPHSYKAGVNWHDTGHYPYKMLLGGDGMQVAVDSRDNETVYTGFQFGNYYRIKRSTGESEQITPQHELGERPLRWNWQTPIHLSAHNQDILYMGANKLYRSFNKGKDWEAISTDLTKGGQQGNVPFGTITTVHESSLRFGLIYCGTDDGLVHVTQDGGITWKNISNGLPSGYWVSRVQASVHNLSRVFVTLNGYRNDNFEAIAFLSEDFGVSWQQLGTNELPLEPVNVLKEDPTNPDLLYMGTDNSLFISLDRGQHFMAMNHNLPAVPIHDLVVHPREKELVVGTHGRSIYLADVKHVQQLKDSILQLEMFAFDIPKIKFRGNWGNAWNTWAKEAPQPAPELCVYIKNAGRLKVSVMAGDIKLQSWEQDATAGLNYPNYKGTLTETAATAFAKQLNEKKKKGEKLIEIKKAKDGNYYLVAGEYKVMYEMNGQKLASTLTIE